MKFYVINLARTPDRLVAFKRNNPYCRFERFNAIDGNTIDREWLLQQNLMTPATKQRYTNGAIGVAMSHRALWQMCVQANEPFTIMEDDAIVSRNFNDAVVKHSTGDWDFVFWGMNLDQRIVIEMAPGVATAQLDFNHDQVLANIDRIKNQYITPTLFKCHWAVGLVCYSVTPKSAAYLLENIFPLKDYFSFRDNFGIDNSIIEELTNMRSYACFPPVALTRNDRTKSTVQQG